MGGIPGENVERDQLGAGLVSRVPCDLVVDLVDGLSVGSYDGEEEPYDGARVRVPQRLSL